MKKNILKIFILFFLFSLISASQVSAETLSSRLSGKILLQVESHGESWYVNPVDKKRYYMGRPLDAFNLMRELGIGITDNDLSKIPVINDNSEEEKVDLNFAEKHKGKIFLQVEQNGEAWYINPDNSQRYFLGRPLDAFNLMRELGLGITNNDLNRIQSALSNSEFLFSEMESDIHDLINIERTKEGLESLLWNSEVAKVAREHSANLAEENKILTELCVICNYPMIHHEGYEFGLYQSERLNNRDVYYFGSSGENIALIPRIKKISYQSEAVYECSNKNLESTFKSKLNNSPEEGKENIIQEEIELRQNLLSQNPEVEIIETIFNTDNEVIDDAVVGWMNSPGHRKNILTADYNEAGIGIAEINNYFFITQVFIKKVDCGYLGGPCCKKNGYLPYCYVPMSCEENICKEKG